MRRFISTSRSSGMLTLKERIAVLSAVVRVFVVTEVATGFVVSTEGEVGAVIVCAWLEDTRRSRAQVLGAAVYRILSIRAIAPLLSGLLHQRDERLSFFHDVRGELRPIASPDVLHRVNSA